MRTRISRARRPDLSAEDQGFFRTALIMVRAVLRGVRRPYPVTVGWWKGRAVRPLLRTNIATFKLVAGKKKVGVSVLGDGTVTIAGLVVENHEDADRALRKNGI